MCVAVPGGPAISVRSSRPVGTVVTIALRPKSVKVDVSDETRDAEPKINEVDALVEKVVYHGFISHLYLRQNNGDPLIVFRQNEDRRVTANRAGQAGPRLLVGGEQSYRSRRGGNGARPCSRIGRFMSATKLNRRSLLGGLPLLPLRAQRNRIPEPLLRRCSGLR